MIYNYNKLYIYIYWQYIYIYLSLLCKCGPIIYHVVLVIYIYTSICQIISIVAISTCAEVSMIFSCYQKGEPAGSIADQYHCLIGWMTEGMTEWWNCNMKLWIGLNWLHLQVNIPYWRNWWNGTKRMTLFFPLDSWIGFHPIGDHPIGYIRMSRPDRDGLRVAYYSANSCC